MEVEGHAQAESVVRRARWALKPALKDVSTPLPMGFIHLPDFQHDRQRRVPLIRRRLLQRPHLRITAIQRQQMCMGASLDNAPGVHHQNLMGIHHSGQTVRNYQRGLILGYALQLRLDGAFVG